MYFQLGQVLKAAFSKRSISLTWINNIPNRSSCTADNDEPNSVIVGYVINSVPANSFTSKIGKMLSASAGQHWLSITYIQPVRRYTSIALMFSQMQEISTSMK